jgi:hypothetical protein
MLIVIHPHKDTFVSPENIAGFRGTPAIFFILGVYNPAASLRKVSLELYG